MRIAKFLLVKVGYKYNFSRRYFFLIILTESFQECHHQYDTIISCEIQINILTVLVHSIFYILHSNNFHFSFFRMMNEQIVPEIMAIVGGSDEVAVFLRMDCWYGQSDS